MLVILSALGAGKIFVRQAHLGRVAQIDELDSHQRLAIHVVRIVLPLPRVHELCRRSHFPKFTPQPILTLLRFPKVKTKLPADTQINVGLDNPARVRTKPSLDLLRLRPGTKNTLARHDKRPGEIKNGSLFSGYMHDFLSLVLENSIPARWNS